MLDELADVSGEGAEVVLAQARANGRCDSPLLDASGLHGGSEVLGDELRAVVRGHGLQLPAGERELVRG